MNLGGGHNSNHNTMCLALDKPQTQGNKCNEAPRMKQLTAGNMMTASPLCSHSCNQIQTDMSPGQAQMPRIWKIPQCTLG